MKLQIASEPRTLNQSIKAVVSVFFGEVVSLVRKGISLGVVLFLALATLSVLNRSADFLKDSSKTRNDQSILRGVSYGSGSAVSQGPRNLLVPRYVSVVPAVSFRQERHSAPTNARDTLRESGYFVSDLDRFSRTLSQFGR